MEVRALTKYVRMSPMKVRQITRQVQGMAATEAADLLKFIPRKSARLVAKTLQSAIANAENNHNLSSESLVVAKAVVDEGPAFKRYKPAARGSAHPIRKRTSHITIILSEKQEAVSA